MTVLDNPLRLEIQKRMTAALETISILNGYHVDVLKCYRGRLIFGEETAVPCLSILESPIPLDQIPSPKGAESQAGLWELVIQGWVKDDKANPTDPAHILMADVKKVLAAERRKLSSQHDLGGIFGLDRAIRDLYIGSGVVRPPDDISSKAYFWLSITLDIVEDMNDAYEV